MAGRERSAGSAAAVVRAVIEELERGWRPGLTVLTGADRYHLDRAQQALIEALVPAESSEFALTVFGDQRVDVGAVVGAVRSAGMFADRRVVLVRDVAALEGDPDPLVEYARNPPPASYLIVRAPELDRRRKLHLALAKSGRELKFEARDPRNAATMIRDVQSVAGEKGLAIDRDAAGLLAELCAGDFYRIDTELEKIRVWQGTVAKGTVTPEILREVASGSAVLSGWEAASALLRGDRRAALTAVVRLLDGGDEPLRLLGGLAYRARSMLQARALMAEGMPAGRAVRAARIWGDSPAQAAEGLARYEMRDVLQFPSLLLDADRTLKSRALAPRAVLGTMLERMIPRRPRGRGEGR